MTELPIVDAHQHFWDLERNYLPWLCDKTPVPFRYGDYSALRRNYLPRDYLRDAAGHHVVKTVHVETEWDPQDFVGETTWLQEIIAATGFPHAIVAGARLDDPEVEAVLAGHARFPQVRCIRHKPRAAPSPDGGDRRARIDGRPGVAPGLRAARTVRSVLRPADVLVAPRGGDAARARLSQDPDHPEPRRTAGGPERTGLAGWRQAMGTLAAEPNVAVKISGLGQPGQPWTVEANGPIVRATIALFGAERCMFASNFPVDHLCADFDTIFAGVQDDRRRPDPYQANEAVS
jgi:predicted TIM-barrel fold metal-dependent hydrolase